MDDDETPKAPLSDTFSGFPKRPRPETVFFTRSEYAVGIAVFFALLGAGSALHLYGPQAGEATVGTILMSVAVIPAGLAMALLERRRTSSNDRASR